jgi:NAD(P)-dependent dehydrogenase (short-subunit alcohol dehydrogenase family)
MQLKNHTALVTGGASGLGQAVRNCFSEAGANVIVLDLPTEANQIEMKKASSSSLLFAPTDVTKAEQVEAALKQAKETFGGVHFAINCAGIAFAIKTLSKGTPSDLETFEMTLKVNLLGTFDVCRLAAKFMAENQPNEDGERGVIINTASIAAFDGQIGQVAYSASKGGIVAMTLPMARDLSPYGIRVNTIAPGIFDTPMLAKLPEPARLSLAEQIPFPKRLGKPAEFAALAKHITENPMLNGEVIRLDGSLRMGIK